MVLRDWLSKWRFGFKGKLTGRIRRRKIILRDVPEGLEVRELLSAIPVIIDNGDPGYYDVRTWQDSSSTGYDSDIATAAGTEAGALASWTFTGLDNGQYYLQATWTPGNNRATNTTFTSRPDFGAAGRNFSVNQRLNPLADELVNGTSFQTLGVVTVLNGTLTVELTNTYADGLVVADAVRLEPVLASDNSVEVRTERLDAITKAMFAFQQIYGHLPPEAGTSVMDAIGKFPLSWRVHLLPMLGYDSLYKSFHLNEPWNSPHNMTLLDQMPDVFRSLDLPDISGLTGFQRIDVPGGFHITGAGGPNLANGTVKDNPETSLLLLELSAEKAVPWTAPDDVSYSPLDPLAGITPTPSGFILAAMANGKIQRLNPNISADDFHALVTWSGKEILSANRLNQVFLPSTLTSDQASQNNLKEIYLGIAYYFNAYNSFPPGPWSSGNTSYDANKNPYLSWRVHLLPYIGEEALYKKFHLDEPWDSPNNLPLAAEMPAIFRSIGVGPGSSVTGYQILNGPGAYEIQGNNRLRFSSILDGIADTLAVIELPASSAVTWTRPDGDIPFNSADSLAGIAPIPSQGLWIVMFDGSVRKISPQITPANLSALATWRGEEILGPSELTNAFVDYPLPESISTRRLNLKQIGLAMQYYYQTYSSFPTTAYGSAVGQNGIPKLSWRVYLLPYLGYSNLYNQFHFDEDWDSPHNLTLLDKMPEIYRSRGIPVGSHLTGIQFLMSPDSYQYYPRTNGGVRGPGLTLNISDSQDTTILAIETQASQAVEWTRPDGDLSFDLTHPLDNIDLTGLENTPADGILAIMVDGSVKTLQPDISPENFAALVTFKGWDVFDALRKSESFFEIGTTNFPKFDDYQKAFYQLRELGLGLHGYIDANGSLPVAGSSGYLDSNGHPFLSWRVYLLPYIGEAALYYQFNPFEPWDSPHNLPLLEKMPEIFLSRGLSPGTNLTGFQFVAGDHSYHEVGPRLAQIIDGTEKSIGIIETPPELAVPWTKPGDFNYDPADPFASIRELISDYLAVMYMNTAARAISPNIGPAQAAALVTWDGGEFVPDPYSSTPFSFTPQIQVTDSASMKYWIETDIASLGATPLGSPLVANFTIKNTGSQPLLISSIQLPEHFSLISPPSSIASGRTAILQISLDTSIGGNFGGLVTINSNVPDQPVLRFTIDADVTSPLDLTLDHASVDENLPVGTIVGTFSATGSIPGNTLAYTLVSGKGGDDNAFFTINSTGQLRTAASFNFENRSSYSIRVRTTVQQTGSAFERSFVISVHDLFDPPSAVSDSATTLEDVPWILDVLVNDINTDSPHPNLRILPGSLGYHDPAGIFHAGFTPKGGTISLRPDGRVDYTPAPNFNGEDSFEYILSDGITRTSGVKTIGIGGEVNLASSSTSTEPRPQIATDSNGNFIIVWEDANSSPESEEIFAQRFDSTGGKIGAQFRVNSLTAGNQESASIAMAPGGEFVVAYKGGMDSGIDWQPGVQFRLFDQNGNPRFNDFVIPTSSPNLAVGTVSVAMNVSGAFTIVWSERDATTNFYNLFGMRFTPDGTPIGSKFMVNTTVGRNQSKPQVVLRKNGSFLVVWQDFTSAANARILGQRFDVAGFKTGTEFVVNTATDYRADFPTIDMNSTGDFIVSWTSRTSSGIPLDILAQRFQADGSRIGTEFTVNSTLTGHQAASRAELHDDGSFVIVWDSVDESAGEEMADIYARKFTPNGSPLGLEFRVNSTTIGAQFFPDIAMDRDGDFVVVWEQYQNQHDIFFQRYKTASDSQLGFVNFNVTPVNDAPSLNPNGNPTLDMITLNVPASSNPGTLISDLIARMAPNGGTTDPDTGALQGIAINGLGGTATGTWQFTIDGGAHWAPIGSTGNSNARLLAANPNTRIRYLPNTGFLGEVKLSFVAWDQTTGTNGGVANVNLRGGITAFSLNYEYASQFVVNSAPVLNHDGNPTLTEIPQGTPAANNPGTLVSDIIARMAPNGGITDINPGALKGIAVNGLGGTGTGIWQFTTDGGTTWLNFGSTGNFTARLLAADGLTRIRYTANTSFLGEAKFAFVAWDRTTGTNGGTANVSSRGGTTPFSAAYEYASQFVVNTAPELNPNGNPTLNSIPGGVSAANNPGTLITDIISRMGPDGGITDPNPLAVKGIAINGLGGTSTGVWEYSVNNGANWAPIGTTGNFDARLLAGDANTRIRYLPNVGFVGEVKLAFVAWDRTSGANGGVANVNLRGGTTAFSINYEYASLFVVNGAPVLNPTNASYLTPIPMNVSNGANFGTLVSDLITRIGSNGITDPNPAALQGIAINGLGGTANGTWQYTTNGGVSWAAIGTTGNSNARLLASNANTRIRFVPNLNFTGTVKLAFVAWDQTSGVNGGIANVSTRGGTTAFSTLYDYTSLSVV